MCLQQVAQKINSFVSLLLPIEWFTWFTYFVILPITSLFGWLALPFVTIAFIFTNVFGVVQLLSRAMTNNTPTNKTSSDDNINELFASTREALMAVLPQASDVNIRQYEKQLDGVEDFDPVLIISPNQTWINQYTLQAYQAVMNAFATDGLQNNRRDEGSLTVFHFANVTEMYTVRGNIRAQYPNAFYDPGAQPQQEPIGTAWILTKVGVRRSDYGQDDSFFKRH